MPTYYPTADGDVTFHDHECQQVVTKDGLTIESPAAEALLEYGHLREGDPTDATKQRAFVPPPPLPEPDFVDAAPQVPDDPQDVSYTSTDDDAPAVPAADVDANADPQPPAAEEAQPQGPAAKTSQKGK